MVYQTTKLKNGIRVATCEMPQMKSVSVGIWVAIGGRHEPEEHCGISHFLEHLLFKGTKTRNAQRLTEEVEGVGGFINAFTTEDHVSQAMLLATLCLSLDQLPECAGRLVQDCHLVAT